MFGTKVYSIDARRLITSAPVVNNKDPDLPDVEDSALAGSYGYVVDAKVAALQNLTVRDNPVNRHYAIKYEPMANSFIEITGRTITGEKVDIGSKNRLDIDKIIRKFNNDINVRHQTIEDFIVSEWRDNVTHRQGLWRIALYDDRELQVDIQQIDQRTIREKSDRLSGHRMWIQTLSLAPGDTFPTKEQFYKKGADGTFYPVTYGGYPDTGTTFGTDDLLPRTIVLPDEPNTTIYLSLFEFAPVTAVMPILLYKIWILYFMRKYSEKLWAAPIIGFIGDTKNQTTPYSSPELQKEINNMAQDLVKLRNFSVMATAGYNRIEPLKVDTAKSGEIFTTNIRQLNEEIMNGLFGSMGQRTAQGNMKSVSEVVDTAYLRFIKGVRTRFEAVLRRFYLFSLLPQNGITDASEDDIQVNWPPLEMYSITDLMQAIKTGVESGVFNDQEEIRTIAARVFGELAENKGNEKGFVPEYVKSKSASKQAAGGFPGKSAAST